VDRICAIVCAFYGVARPDILKARRGWRNDPRNTAIYLVTKLRRDTLGQIVRAFEIQAARSAAVTRMTKRLANEPELCKGILKMELTIKKNQEQT